MTVRRLKTYTGSQGFVYQYYFVGKRPAKSGCTEYIFDVTSDRKITYAVSIFVAQEILAAWADSHGRSLTDAEQYAAVKLRLFRAFDELPDMQAHGRELLIDPPALEASLATLGIE